MPRAKPKDTGIELRELISREVFKLNRASKKKDESTLTPQALASLKALQDLKAQLDADHTEKTLDIKTLNPRERDLLLWARELEAHARGDRPKPEIPERLLSEGWSEIAPPSQRLAIWRTFASSVAKETGCTEQEAYARLARWIGYPNIT